jgi:hypothetical protein
MEGLPLIPIPWAALIFNRFTAAAVGVALVAALYLAHRDNLIQQGYDTAMNEVKLGQADLQRELVRERSRLISIVQGLHHVQENQRQALAKFRAGQRDADQRLRDAKADFDRRVAAADAEALRRYAEAIDGDLGRCTADVERFADEAAQCSIAAHTLKGYVDALP